MSSNSEARRAQRKRPEQEPDLSVQYRRIGIKAVAAAAARGKSKEVPSVNPDRQRKTGARKKARQ